MLRLIYLGALFKLYGKGSWRMLCCGWNNWSCWCGCCAHGRVEANGKPRDEEKQKEGGWTQNELRRRLVDRVLSPSLVLSSMMADIDLATDWYFWISTDFKDTDYKGIEEVALFFTLLGTITWLLLATDGMGWLRIRASSGASMVALHRYWPLVNAILEDLPQLVITAMTTAFGTVAGTLNIATAVFACMVKATDAYENRVGDLPGDLELISNTPQLFELRLAMEHRVEQQRNYMAYTSSLIARANSNPDLEDSMRATFELARSHEDWVRSVKVHSIILSNRPIRGECRTVKWVSLSLGRNRKSVCLFPGWFGEEVGGVELCSPHGVSQLWSYKSTVVNFCCLLRIASMSAAGATGAFKHNHNQYEQSHDLSSVRSSPICFGWSLSFRVSSPPRPLARWWRCLVCVWA